MIGRTGIIDRSYYTFRLGHIIPLRYSTCSSELRGSWCLNIPQSKGKITLKLLSKCFIAVLLKFMFEFRLCMGWCTHTLCLNFVAPADNMIPIGRLNKCEWEGLPMPTTSLMTLKRKKCIFRQKVKNTVKLVRLSKKNKVRNRLGKGT